MDDELRTFFRERIGKATDAAAVAGERPLTGDEVGELLFALAVLSALVDASSGHTLARAQTTAHQSLVQVATVPAGGRA